MEFKLTKKPGFDIDSLAVIQGAIGTQGRVCIHIPVEVDKDAFEGVERSSQIAKAFEACFARASLLIHRGRQVKSHYRKAGADLSRRPDGQGYDLRFNAGALLCLPGVDVAAELEDVAGLMSWMKAQMLSRPSCQVSFAIYRERNESGLYPSPSASIRQHEAEAIYADSTQDTAAVKDMLRSRIQESATLIRLCREVLHSCGKIGPHAWFNFEEQSFFDRYEGPHQRYLLASLSQ